jgi:hypothetical protein
VVGQSGVPASAGSRDLGVLGNWLAVHVFASSALVASTSSTWMHLKRRTASGNADAPRAGRHTSRAGPRATAAAAKKLFDIDELLGELKRVLKAHFRTRGVSREMIPADRWEQLTREDAAVLDARW